MACTRSTSGNLLRRRCRGQQSQLMGSEDRARNRHERRSSRGGELDFAICHEFKKKKLKLVRLLKKWMFNRTSELQLEARRMEFPWRRDNSAGEYQLKAQCPEFDHQWWWQWDDSGRRPQRTASWELEVSFSMLRWELKKIEGERCFYRSKISLSRQNQISSNWR